MAYAKQTWADGAGGGTPLSAARLNVMENGIEAASVTEARKTVDETIDNSTVMQADDELFFAVVASEIWGFECLVWFKSATSIDIKFNFTIPSGALRWAPVSPSETDGDVHRTTMGSFTSGGALNVGASTGADRGILFRGTASVGGTGGNVALNWAQVVAGASGTTVVFKDSYLVARKLN